MLHQPSAFTLPLPSFGGPSHSPLSSQSNHNSFSSVPSFAPSVPAFGAAPFSHTPLAKCSHDGWGQQPFTNGQILNETEAKHRQPNFAFGAQFHTPPIITPAPSPNPPFAEFPAHLPAAATTQASGMDTDKDMAPAAESPSLQQFHSAAFASSPSAPSTTAVGLSLSLDQAPPSSTPFSSSLAVTSAAALSPSISRSLTASTPVAFSGDSSLPPSLITSFSSSVLPSAPQSDLAFVPLMPSFPIGPAPGWQRVAGNMFRNSITKETHVCDFNCRSRVFSSQLGYFICGITGLQSRAHAKDGHKKRASESAISFSFSADPEALPAADAPAPVDCAISSEIEDSKPAVKRVMSFKANQ